MEAINKALESFGAHCLQDTSLNQECIGVVNYQQPSYEKRLYIVDVKSNKIIGQHYVAHGSASTCALSIAKACSFSNVVGSRKSSLGAIKTGAVYYGKYGKSLKLHGLDSSNSQIYNRFIVLHPSQYVTESYIKQNGYAGRSWGCLAVSPEESGGLIDLLKDGHFIYAYF
jgi:hypothetical protein